MPNYDQCRITCMHAQVNLIARAHSAWPGTSSFWSFLGPYYVHQGSSECQSEYFLILKLRSKNCFWSKIKSSRGGHFGGFWSRGRSECTGGGHISMGDVLEKCFWQLFFPRFSVRFGGSGGRVFDGFRWFWGVGERPNELGRVGRSVGRSVGQEVGRSPPLPPRPERSME